MPSTAMVALSAATLGIAVTGVLSTLRGVNAPAAGGRLLAVYALLAGLAAIPLIIAFVPGLYTVYMPATLPMLLAVPAAVYVYVEALTATDGPPGLAKRHGILPLAGCLIALGYWTLPEASRQTMFVHGELPPGVLPPVLAVTTFVMIAVWALGSLGYLLLVLKRLFHFRARLRDLYSNVEARELRWIEWLMASLAALWATAALTLVSDNFGPGLLVSGEWIQVLTACLLLFVFAAAPIKVPAREETTQTESGQSIEPVAEKYTRSALSEEHAERLALRINAAMREHRLFLDPNLSLQKLSQHVGGAPNLISQTLNERLGSTFFDYVARWRVDAAKPLVLAAESSILTIAIEVGFNSKSTFYKAFKKETGMTPTTWREAHIANPGTPEAPSEHAGNPR